jgi:hypothetical protein
MGDAANPCQRQRPKFAKLESINFSAKVRFNVPPQKLYPILLSHCRTSSCSLSDTVSSSCLTPPGARFMHRRQLTHLSLILSHCHHHSARGRPVPADRNYSIPESMWRKYGRSVAYQDQEIVVCVRQGQSPGADPNRRVCPSSFPFVPFTAIAAAEHSRDSPPPSSIKSGSSTVIQTVERRQTANYPSARLPH